jgi:chemotaxis protein CheX
MLSSGPSSTGAPTASEVPELLLANLVSATEEVFETMVFAQVSAKPPIPQSSTSHRSGVVATVAFAGHRRGAVALHTSDAAARAIAGAMLGLPASSVNGQMPDAMGEVANMIGGSLRTRMAAFEPAWALSVPTVTIGSDFATSWKTNVARVMCPFEFQQETIFVELILTQ